MEILNIGYKPQPIIPDRIYHLKDLDENKVKHAHVNPRIIELAGEYGFKVSGYQGLTIFDQKNECTVFGIDVARKCIKVFKLYERLAEEVIQLVLGESLKEAEQKFKGK